MIKVLISGALGRMGKKLYDSFALSDKATAVCGVDLKEDLSCPDYPVYASFADVKMDVDVVVDFSSPLNLNNVLDFCVKNKIPAVLCATGCTAEQIEQIKETSKSIAIFRSGNMSLGVNVLVNLVKKAAAMLGDFDVEIIEKHHNLKIDAPSGTALMLANAVNSQFNDSYNYEYDRHSKRAKRPKNEIGIHSVRGGTIVGEHDVIFAGRDEVITLSHSATSKEVFAVGAIRAAKFIASRSAGLYDMNDIMSF